MSDTRDNTTAEFERMVRSSEFATIHDLAAVAELRDLLREVQSATDSSHPTESVEALPTRR